MMRIKEPGRLKLGILASGRGSNFLAIYKAIQDGKLDADIKVLVSDKKDALALLKAEERGIDAFFINPADFENREKFEEAMVNLLQKYDVDAVALAGYMRLLGKTFLQAFPCRVLNIHPALLPAFAGIDAQKQALQYGVRYSGCTVHFVDEGMDTGPIILQEVVPVYQHDTEETLSLRILEKEHQIYWQALQLLAEGRLYIEGRKIIIMGKKERGF